MTFDMVLFSGLALYSAFSAGEVVWDAAKNRHDRSGLYLAVMGFFYLCFWAMSAISAFLAAAVWIVGEA